MMQISTLQLSGFRNLATADLIPAPDFNVFWGQNAQGKTNLLEAIYLLGTLKSFRTQRNEDLICSGVAHSCLKAWVRTARVDHCLEIQLDGSHKRVRLDDKSVRRAHEVLGILRPVLFSPEEVHLIKGPPAGRRDLLDRALLHMDPGYLERFQDFLRVLRQRNHLLRQNAHPAELAPWTRSLIHAGALIRAERFHFAARLRPHLARVYDHLSEGREQAELDYPGSSSGDFAEDLRQDLARLQQEERRLGQTLAGPHRDDPNFLVNGRSLRAFGSQGQQRCFILAFKAAQIELLEELTGHSPLLLLDDITSELDSRRKSFLFEFLRERRGQVFLTTTDAESLRRQGLAQARFFHVSKGHWHHD
ncbi:DNA replication/repair protein RecF [Geoalkalibacter sp.]|uniref:DNA replication/repair protein RecF n=1 Tax=Geoalkalibacter sp. TaxID=3041440 RepID=UPI00272ED4D3|nr:DNA replication/repair protein RecF [Geoalkalibacter sp.]